MKSRILPWVALGMLSIAVVHFTAPAQTFTGPIAVQVDNLTTPLGIDDPAPHFSWKLQDAATGAAQTAYQLQLASTAEQLAANNADVWKSGVIKSNQSLNI